MRRRRHVDLTLREVTWYQFDLGVAWIADHFRGMSLAGVYGEPRGGLPLAVALSHRMRLPMLDRPRPEALWVDDIVDSGKALRAVTRAASPHTAALYWRNGAAVSPDVWAFDCQPGEWLVFPWECLQDAVAEAREYASR